MTAERIHAPQFQLYKESTIPWAPVIPNHWETKRAKSLFKKMERPVRESDEVVTCFRDGTVTLRRNRRESGFTESLKEIGYQGIRPGDLVIHAMDAFAGAIGVSDSAGKGTPVYSVCTPIGEANPLYYAHALREMSRSKWIESLAKGIRERSSDFRFTEFSAQVVPVPPPEEQATIVRFLDHADDQIRRYIAAKERLIALLEEERQALVHQAVTRGLDPNVKLKSSGVEWLGDVPEHWRLVPNKAVLRLKKDVVENDTSNYTLLSLTKQGIIPRNMEDPTGKFPANFESYQIVEPGDLVFCLFDVDETPRTVGLSTLHGMVTGAYTRFTCQKGTMGNFLFLLYLALDNNKLLKPLYSGLRKTIPKSSFLSAKIALPTKEEQASIVEYLDNATADIDASIARARREVELMNEYRTRLIADVVTGQLDVREATAQHKVTPRERE